MRKFFTLLLMLAIGVQLMAQKGFQPVKRNLDFAQPNQVLKQKQKSKAPGDVIWAEDFDGADWAATSNNGVPVPANAPANWTLYDNTGNNYNWRWDTIGPRGIYTSPGDDCHEPAGALMSTTGSNGYLMLEADYFNTAPDCSEFYGTNMDCYFQYDGGIDFSQQTAVHLVFEQANRFCCLYGESSDAWFSISIDNGTTWNSICVSEAPIAYSTGVLGQNAYFSEFDITNMVSGHSNVWFRFHLLELSHYYWLVDDVIFVVPEDNDIQLLDYWNDYIHYRDGSDEFPLKETYDFTEGFYEYPYFLIQNFRGFHLAINNFGGKTQTNIVHNVRIFADNQIDASFFSIPIDSLKPGESDTLSIQSNYYPYFNSDIVENTNLEILHFITSDQIEPVYLMDTLSRKYKIHEYMLSPVNFDNVNSTISPDDYANFDEDGDGLGFIFGLPSPTYDDIYKLEGVEVYIAPNRGEEYQLFENGDAKIIARVSKIDKINGLVSEVISSSLYTLSPNDTSSIVFIPFETDGFSEMLFEKGNYLVSINMYGTYFDSYGQLKSWRIYNSNNTVQKRSLESGLTINHNLQNPEDIGIVLEGPAIRLVDDSQFFTSFGRYINCKFNVKDFNENEIVNANVYLNGYGTKMTNNLGDASFSQIEYGESIEYSISHEGYEDFSKIIETDIDIFDTIHVIQSFVDISFNVTDDGAPVIGAEILFSDFDPRYTDQNGICVFERIPFDTSVNYIVEKEGFNIINGGLEYMYANKDISIQLVPLSIDLLANIDSKIYPNPSTGIFNIEADGTFDLQIMNMSGKLVYESQFIYNQQVDLINYEKGVYFVRLAQEGKQITKTIIIQ